MIVEHELDVIRSACDRIDACRPDRRRVCGVRCVQYGDDGNGYVDYVTGANTAGFVKVADAMLAYGIV